jgi:ABC-type nitrate/sulfonate/bicarbonate transport system permease component
MRWFPALLKRLLPEVALPALLVALLWLASADSQNFFFPPLAKVVERFRALWLGPRFWADVLPSLQRLAAGYALACIAGIVLGVAIGSSTRLRRVCEPAMEFFRSIPPVALIPLFLMIFGFGDSMKITVIAAGAVWPVLLNAVEGVKAADPVLDDICRCYQIKGWARWRHFIVPGALPHVVVGMRIALAIVIVLMVISEMFAAMDGLGSAVIYFQRSFEIPEMWSGVLMLGLFGFALSLLFRAFEQRLLRWYHGMRDSERRN